MLFIPFSSGRSGGSIQSTRFSRTRQQEIDFDQSKAIAQKKTLNALVMIAEPIRESLGALIDELYNGDGGWRHCRSALQVLNAKG